MFESKPVHLSETPFSLQVRHGSLCIVCMLQPGMGGLGPVPCVFMRGMIDPADVSTHNTI